MTKSLRSVDEQVSYQVAIVLPHSMEILAERDSNSLRLPTIMIQRWNRVAEQITGEITVRWNLQTVVVDILPASDDAPCLAILEALTSDDSVTSKSFRPSHLDLISIGTQHRRLLEEILTETSTYRDPLVRLGWIGEAKRWLQANVRDHEVHFTNDIRQLNAGAGFVLIRLGVSDGPAYWVKAAGAPNRHEAAITEMLSERSPAFLPPLVATHHAWNAWAMEEVGSALTDSVDAETVALVSLSLARLQQQTFGHMNRFLNCGCGDQRIETLRGYLPDFLAGVAKLVSDTAFVVSSGTTGTVIPRVERTLRLALEKTAQLGIPDTINNNDMKLANIVFDGRQCAFIDWCHAYWGNPFLTFQHLHIYLARCLPLLSRPFRDGYARAWADHLSESQIEGALTFTPIIAPYAYLCARGPASLASAVADPGMRKLFLGIVRRIVAAGDQLSRTERQAYA